MSNLPTHAEQEFSRDARTNWYVYLSSGLSLCGQNSIQFGYPCTLAEPSHQDYKLGKMLKAYKEFFLSQNLVGRNLAISWANLTVNAAVYVS